MRMKYLKINRVKTTNEALFKVTMGQMVDDFYSISFGNGIASSVCALEHVKNFYPATCFFQQ